jgi:predicted acyltransferase
MSQMQPQGSPGETPIVIHAPMTGEPDRLAGLARPLPTPTEAVFSASPATAISSAPAASVAPAERVLGLDAFRGLLLLAMNFTFTIPPWGPFAKWMYHTQVPPSPTRAYVGVAGLTWQDLLFPMFVFTMAAALPIAMGGRLARGKPYPEIIWTSIRRAFLLLVFALVIGHVNPYWTQDYTKRGNALAIVGLLVSFAVFVNPPPTWKPAVVRMLKSAGWAGVLALLFLVPLLYGQQFNAERRDFIMAALAFCTVAGTLVWLFTRARLTARLIVFGVVAAGRMIAPLVPAFGAVWNASPLPWFYQSWYLDLLLLVIPGTIAGDLVVRWMRRSKDEEASAGWSSARLITLAMLGLSTIVTLCVGLYERRYPLQTTIVVVVTASAMLWTARGARTERDRILARLVAWSSVWLVVGMLVEPLEGGIKKDPLTLGFLLLMAGLSIAALASLLIIADVIFAGKRLRALALIGQNALFAYVLYMLGGEHLLWLTGIGDAFTGSWQAATVRSVVLTGLVGAAVWFATRRRLIWRA